ncbi:MAG: ArsR/SmtB family transcription factor [Myxococcota bacterium]
MDKRLNKIYETRARILKAMAHPSRLFIIDSLAQRDYCVYELTRLIGSDISTVSKHLSILKNVGIVSIKKDKNNVYYHLKCSCVTKYFMCIDGVIKSNIEFHNQLSKSIK